MKVSWYGLTIGICMGFWILVLAQPAQAHNDFGMRPDGKTHNIPKLSSANIYVYYDKNGKDRDWVIWPTQCRVYSPAGIRVPIPYIVTRDIRRSDDSTLDGVYYTSPQGTLFTLSGIIHETAGYKRMEILNDNNVDLTIACDAVQP